MLQERLDELEKRKNELIIATTYYEEGLRENMDEENEELEEVLQATDLIYEYLGKLEVCKEYVSFGTLRAERNDSCKVTYVLGECIGVIKHFAGEMREYGYHRLYDGILCPFIEFVESIIFS